MALPELRTPEYAGEVMTFPADGMELTHILVVSDVDESRRWYTDVLGAEPYREYGGTSAVLSFNGAWLLLVTGAGPTDDKPTVTLAAPHDMDRLDHLFTIRVPDCRAAYETLRGRGAKFLTPPVDHGSETRCFFRDPDGHLFEISEYRPPA
jgi:catechol 2,3-dioxygenase-like lactoylglutathione lyase family enzyme